MAGASIDTTTLSCAAEILSTASALTVSLPFKTMSNNRKAIATTNKASTIQTEIIRKYLGPLCFRHLTQSKFTLYTGFTETVRDPQGSSTDRTATQECAGPRRPGGPSNRRRHGEAVLHFCGHRAQ